MNGGGIARVSRRCTGSSPNAHRLTSHCPCAAWLAPFRDSFTAAVWPRVLVLIAGAILAPGQRTVSAALRVMGLADQPGFGRYHKVLSEAHWDGRALARKLLWHLLDKLLPEGEVVIVPDDSIERRWGPCIRDRGIYRDPVRTSRGFFVKTSGLRWLSLAVVLPIPWARRRRARLAKVPPA